MIHSELNQDAGVAIIRPDQMHGVSEADFKQLTDLVDHYLKDHDSLCGLIIASQEFPGWEDLMAFISHIRFIRNHHRSIQKVALVSDSQLLSMAPNLINHFVSAKVRNFPFLDIEKAKIWAASIEVRSSNFLKLDGYPDNIVAFRAEGMITRDDYEETLIPEVEKKIKVHGKAKLLYWCDEGFKGFTAGAIWDDARFGLMHLGDFLKIAVVSDYEWVRQSVKLFAPLVRAPVQVFHNADIEDANQWIKED